MTSAPMDLLVVPSTPAPGGTPGPTSGTEGAVDPLLFALLVDQALATGQQADGTEEGTPEEGEADVAAEVPPWAGLAALVAVVTPVSRQPDEALQSASTSVPAAEPDPRPAALPAPSQPVDAPAATTTPPPATTTSPTTPPTTPPTASPSTAAPTATSAATSAGTDDTTAAVRAADPGTVPVVTGGPATVTPGAAPAQGGDAQPARSVVTQVIPEITRLVSDGEGVHRVTLQLNPKALGEVRVVLTMRHGDVHVRIAGGEEARHALAASSAELTRALQHLGIDDHRLTLTDLAPASATRGAGTELHDQQRHHHSPGGNHPDPHGQNSHSWMGDARSATDGSSTSSPTDRTRGSDRVHEASHARAAGGVDLRM